MAKVMSGSPLVTDFNDAEPPKGRPVEQLVKSLPPVAENTPISRDVPQAAHQVPAPVAAPVKVALPKPIEDRFPWGFLVKHPSFGAVRVRRDEAANEVEAAEVYRKKKCPHMRTAALEHSGMRLSVLKFTPADTEIGK